MRRQFVLTLIVLAAIAVVGYAVPTRAQGADKILVFAASSLTEALTEVSDAYARTGNPKPVFSFAASSTLARQIENGAPAVLFVAADEEWMNYLAARELIVAGTRTSFIGNSLVLVAPADRPLQLSIESGFPLDTALGAGKLSLADPESVPAGRYAKAALENLGVWPTVALNVVRGDSVRSALAFVERGEAAAGIVYATDAMLTRKVAVVGTFPPTSHAAITYPLAIVAGHDTPAARSFRDFMLGDEAKAVYRKFGFAVK